MWLREISSCSCLTVLPGPAWVMLSKTKQTFISPSVQFQVGILLEHSLCSKRIQIWNCFWERVPHHNNAHRWKGTLTSLRMTSDFLPLLHFVFFPSSIFGAKCRLLRSQKPLASSLSLRFCHRRFTFFQLRQRLRSFAASRSVILSKKSSTKQRLISLTLGASQIYFTIVNRLFTNFAGNAAFPFFIFATSCLLCHCSRYILFSSPDTAEARVVDVVQRREGAVVRPLGELGPFLVDLGLGGDVGPEIKRTFWGTLSEYVIKRFSYQCQLNS